MAQTDLELLNRFRACGDAQAFSEIVRRYASTVFSAGRRILGDNGLAEDVAQETFYRLMRRPEMVRQSLGGWLHRSATRLAVDARRSERARLQREQSHLRHENDPTWAIISSELDEAIATLPDASRELLVRHFLRGEPQAQLASDLSTSPATLSRRIKVSLEELRMEMRRRGIDACPLTLGLVCGRNAAGIFVPRTLSMSLGKMSIWCAARSVYRSTRLQRWLRVARNITPRSRLVRVGWTLLCIGFAFVVLHFCAQRFVAAPTADGSSSPLSMHEIER